MIAIHQTDLTDDLKNRIPSGLEATTYEETGISGLGSRQAFIAQTSQQLFVGAATCQVFWGGLHLIHLFVEKPFRSQGIGSQLITQVLDYGSRQGCSFVFVETMSFLALEFYLKLGFTLEFTRTGFVRGAAFHYLRKEVST